MSDGAGGLGVWGLEETDAEGAEGRGDRREEGWV